MRNIFSMIALGFFTVLADAGTTTPLPDSSLFQLEAKWQRDDGKTMTLEQLRGQPTMITLFFSHCANICPMIVGQLKLLDQDLPPKVKHGMRFVMVTLDADQDDSQAMAKYRQEMNLAADHWLLLHGSQDDTRALANLLGVQYTPKKPDGQIEHTGMITLLDREGRIRGQWPTISDRPELVKKVEALEEP